MIARLIRWSMANRLLVLLATQPDATRRGERQRGHDQECFVEAAEDETAKSAGKCE